MILHKKNCMLCGKNKGFTLAEVLITLGIIGVVAAMTLPILVGKYQKRVVALKLKKTYSVLNNALKMSVADNGDFETWGEELYGSAANYVEKFWKPYINSIKTCNTRFECNYNNPKGSAIFNCRNSNGEERCAVYWFADKISMLVLQDGIHIAFNSEIDDYHNTVTSKNIYVDINGAKGPNTIGKDAFIFKTMNNMVLPYGYNATKEAIQNDCSKDGYKKYCAAKIMQDGWQIKNDYPW